VRNRSTSSFGIDARFPTSRSNFLALLGITRLLGVRYAPHTESRTGSIRQRLDNDPDNVGLQDELEAITGEIENLVQLLAALVHPRSAVLLSFSIGQHDQLRQLLSDIEKREMMSDAQLIATSRRLRQTLRNTSY
ncbi:MAG TPA: hypothetical protein VMU81_24270, partial [Acetobacteraceae bacterium]|nr:hypothetical protein [Acetobacteraceae bacterium]